MMENKDTPLNMPYYLPLVEKQCKQIEQSNFLKHLDNDTISIVLLSVFNLQKVIDDHNLLLAVNLTKINGVYLKQLTEILHNNICVDDTIGTFKQFVFQFDVTADYLKKNSLMIPFDVLVNELCKQSIDSVWQQSIASLATTEYILAVINKHLNKFSTGFKLNESFVQSSKLLELLTNEQMYSPEIEKGVNDTVKSFLNMFEILCEVFFNNFVN